MEIINNYDLIGKVKHANGKPNLKGIALSASEGGVYAYVTTAFLDIASSRYIRWSRNLVASLFVFGLIFSAFRKIERDNKEFNANKAFSDFSKLLLDLRNDLSIDTSMELLRQSKVDYVEYGRFDQDGKVKFQQHKSILVPAYNNLGNIEDVRILQKRQLRGGEYHLSKNEL